MATKPVITVGKILDAKLAEDVLEAEEVDGVVSDERCWQILTL